MRYRVCARDFEDGQMRRNRPNRRGKGVTKERAIKDSLVDGLGLPSRRHKSRDGLGVSHIWHRFVLRGEDIYTDKDDNG